MGLLDFASKVLTEYKADISDHKAKVKELSGAQKELAKEELAAAQARNKQTDTSIDKLAKLGIAIAAVAVTVKIGFDAIEFAGKRADLASAAAGVSIEGLRKATFGLRTDTELLTTAARLNHSVFQLSQEDMETAAKAMIALGERGGDAQEAIDAVTEALVTGKTKGLKQFGIEVDETKDKAAKFRDIMKSLSGVAGEVSESSFDASDKVSMLKVSFSNAVDDMKLALGKLALALAPLLDLLAKAVGIIAKIANATFEGVDEWQREAIEARTTGGGALAGGMALGAANALNAKIARAQKGGNFTPFINGINGQVGASGGIGNSLGDEKRGGGAPINADAEEQRYRDQVEALWAAAGFDTRSVDVGSLKAPEAAPIDWNKIDEGLKGLQASVAKSGEEFTTRDARYGAFSKGKEQNFLESTFGKVEDFGMYAKAFSTLTGAVSSSIGAWVEGSMSAGKAFKAFIGQALEGLAAQAGVESLKHAAYALGSLAFGDFRGAAQHGAAAAEFAAVAVAAAVAAKEMGHGGKDYSKSAGGSGGSPKAPSVGGSGSSSGAAGPTVIVAYGDPFADDNQRARQLSAEKTVGRVLGNTYVQKS